MPWLICNIGKNRAIKKYNIEFNNFYNPYKQPLLKGLGKPEPLKHQLSGMWSRRITKEHRIIYEVKAEEYIFIPLEIITEVI